MDEKLLQERVVSHTITLIQKQHFYPFRKGIDSSRACGSAVPFNRGPTFQHSLWLKIFALNARFRPWPTPRSHVE